MLSLKEYIAINDAHEKESGAVRVARGEDLSTASISLPDGISLEARAERMNEFWNKLVEFQFDDVVVVALCVSRER